MRWRGPLLALLLLAASVPAHANTFEEAVALYDDKDYKAAFAIVRPLAEQGDANADATLRYMDDTTHASGGTIITHVSRYWNLRIEDQFWFPPEAKITLAPSRRAVFSMDTSDTLTFASTIWWREIG